jgi:hypothetical protein
MLKKRYTILKAFIWVQAIAMAVSTFVMAPATTVGAASDPGTIRLQVKASPSAMFATEQIVNNKKWVAELEEHQMGDAYLSALPPDTTLQYDWNHQARAFGVTPDGEIIDLQQKATLIVSQSTKTKLAKAVQALRTKHYGELLPWEEAESVLPRYSSFTIVDIETGRSFQGQRRAGSSHADVQPLTKQDSMIMKEIYGGSWSWDRRAVLIRSQDRQLAGSMHGMPHGGDGIPNNAFSGHFCIHFLNSTTHGSGHIDGVHQAMIQKAAGRLPAYLSQLSPTELVDLWIAGVNQSDRQLIEGTSFPEAQTMVPYVNMRRLTEFRALDTSAALHLEVTIAALVTPAGSSSSQQKNFVFKLERAAVSERWFILSVTNA